MLPNTSLSTNRGLRLSLIIPCYNAMGKIGRCLNALRRTGLPASDYEVIFVDDCSTDGTYEFLAGECASFKNWNLIKTETNSGSPSAPRNMGLDVARGEYVFFLDCDDEIFPDTFSFHLHHAYETRADIVRGYLIAEDQNGRQEMNLIRDWSTGLPRLERIRQIMRDQSTTVCSLIRTDILRKNNIRWRTNIRMGEDTLFLIDVLLASEHIEYIDHPTFIYVKKSSITPSSTQIYGDRELRENLTVWGEAIESLARWEIDYVSLRLQVALEAALRALVFVNKGDIRDKTLLEFSAFLRKYNALIEAFAFRPRMGELIRIALSGDPQAFRAACRPRLLIAGYDLKFIKPHIPALVEFYDIRLDEWPGHDAHDEAASHAALDWAELIWCEWLLGNAVWYSRNKHPGQILIARMHRFELGRDFWERMEVSNVDAVAVVSTLFFERVLERFPSIGRSKVRILYNAVDVSEYMPSADLDRRFRLGMIGVLPARKGLDRALTILSRLRQKDPRYTLDIYGKNIKDLPWLASDPAEMAYFQGCENRIRDLELEGAVHFRGHANIHSALAAHGTGVILSLSDSVHDLPCFESFHLAIADGFAGGGVSLVRHWEGAEFIWPEQFILSCEEDIVARILSWRDNPDAYLAEAEAGRKFLQDNYTEEQFIINFRSLFRQAHR